MLCREKLLKKHSISNQTMEEDDMKQQEKKTHYHLIKIHRMLFIQILLTLASARIFHLQFCLCDPSILTNQTGKHNREGHSCSFNLLSTDNYKSHWLNSL